MIEVFRTNVTDQEQANRLVDMIHSNFYGCQANFDLEDCDHILRIKCTTAVLLTASLINFLQASGIRAEVLEDEILVPSLLKS